MKKILFALIIAGMHLSVIAQELMTIGEVFSFEIGDQFQTEGTADHQPPNADRITITGKYFSLDNDTLFYIRFHDSYYSEVIWGENPYLEYHFWTKSLEVPYLGTTCSCFDQLGTRHYFASHLRLAKFLLQKDILNSTLPLDLLAFR